MIHSMTAYASGSAHSSQGALTIELRTVNSRFLDIHLRLADELRFLETSIREWLSRQLTRGKVDVRVSYELSQEKKTETLDTRLLLKVAHQLTMAREFIPDIAPPRLFDLLNTASSTPASHDQQEWQALCQQACEQALMALQAARQREGERLALTLAGTLQEMQKIVNASEDILPLLNENQQKKIALRLKEALEAVSPDGFTQISGEELSARIAQEASLFSLRNDVAEELARLRSHLEEFSQLLQGKIKNKKQSVGKRLDFLCQEMNREANTLGSKAAGLDITHAAIDLKLYIEQLREQAQNIE